LGSSSSDSSSDLGVGGGEHGGDDVHDSLSASSLM